MLNIDTSTMLIELTRGDTASIVFSAKDKQGNVYLPSTGDKLKFAVAKKTGGTITFEVENKFDEMFNTASPTLAEFNAEKTKYFTKADNVYTRCTAESVYDTTPNTYHTNEMWTITIGAVGSNDWYQKDEDGELILEDGEPVLIKTGDYAFDVQLTTTTGVDTIIGKTDTISPTFRVWGEVGE